MEGGINAWRGLVAGGPPEAGTAYFSTAGRAEEFIALAWSLEEGSRRFYAGLAESMIDSDAKRLFQDLMAAEEQHKSSLLQLFRSFSGGAEEKAAMIALLPGIPPGDVMEGGVRVDEALAWTRGKSIPDVLDLSMAFESNAYDLYVKMERALTDERAQRVFRSLALEEHCHLDRMASLIERAA